MLKQTTMGATFLLAVTKHLMRTLRKEGLILDHGFGKSPSWQRRHGGRSSWYTQSQGVEREDAGVQLTFSVYSSPGPQSMGWWHLEIPSQA